MDDKHKAPIEIFKENMDKLPRPASLLEEEIKSLREQLTKAKAFKEYVHRRLDDAGIPIDPDSPHKEHGCRIGGRLDFILEQLAKERELRKELETDFNWSVKKLADVKVDGAMWFTDDEWIKLEALIQKAKTLAVLCGIIASWI